ncbi:5-oxoproline transporter, DUF979 family subunit [Bacillus cytotoxicus]
MSLITLDTIYYLLGFIVAFIAIRVAFDKQHPNRIGSSLFWALFSITFLFGKIIAPFLHWLYGVSDGYFSIYQ